MAETIWEPGGAPGGDSQAAVNALRRLCRALFLPCRALLLLALVALLAGCGRAEQAASETQDDYGVTFAVEPAAATVGEGSVVITLKDPQGQPVSDARLDVEANMSHAGMTPVNGQAAPGTDGVYRALLKWTMAGDWFVDVKFTLADGKTVSRRFPVVVKGE
jgi:hypothetical protein